jgi:hypothetical protein
MEEIMDDTLIAKKAITINAPKSAVWMHLQILN